MGLIAGGGEKGVIYQLKGKTARALYDSAMSEVTSFAVDPQTGNLYAGLVSASKKGALLPDKWIGPVKGDAPPDDTSPIKGSEVVRIRPSGAVDILWSSKREGALGLAFDVKAQRLFISTGTSKKGRGRLYAVDVSNRDRLLLIARTQEPMVTALMNAPTKGALIVGTAPGGRLLRVGPGLRNRSVYVSQEQDLHRVSKIGRIWFDADVPSKAKVELSLRTGNTRKQDKTWSDWSAPVTGTPGGGVKVPRGRFVQFRVALNAGSKGRAPTVKSLHASLIRRNEAPEVREVFLLRRGVYMKPMPPEEEKERKP